MIRSKIERLVSNFEQKCKGPIQGSEEWLALRIPSKNKKRGRIGGSEVGTLLGVNPWKKIKELMLQKQGKKKSVVDNIMVHLGSLLEEVTVLVFEQKFNTKVYAKNVSIIDPSNLNDFIFSPDGIALLPRVNNKVILEPIKEDSMCCPVLIEIKNPWSRKLTQDGNVPPEYMAQIQAGLISIPLVHCGIFIDCATKLCAYEQLFSTGFNNILHDKYQPPNADEVISKGVILFTGKLPSKFWKKDCSIIEIEDKRIYDFGDCAYMNTFAVVKGIKEKILDVEYLPVFTSDEDKYIEIINNKIKNSKTIGIMCYKVFDISYTICNREKDIIKDIRTQLNKYSQGELDIDEDYVPRKRKRSPSANAMPNLVFDFDSDSDKEKKTEKEEEFSFDIDY